MDLLLTGLIDLDNILLKLLELLLQGGKLRIEALLVVLVLVELIVQEDHLLFITNFFLFIECLFEHDTITFILQLAILLVVND